MAGGRHRPSTRVAARCAPLLARNFEAAIRSLTDKHHVSYIIGLMGPQTADELMGHCGRHLPHLSRYALNRALYALMKSGVIVRHSLGENFAPFWAAPGVPVPADAKRRARGGKAMRAVSRRAIPPAGPTTSWWTVPRDQFQTALKARWKAGA